LLRRGVDVMTAIEDECATLPEDQLLNRAAALARVLFTQDIRFRALAENRQRQGVRSRCSSSVTSFEQRSGTT
jgi:hypothetical protein